jgi:hypothetical protein
VPWLAVPSGVVLIDTGRQLFVDDYLVEHTSLTRVYHRPEPYAKNPILTADRPWEQGKAGPEAFPFSDGVWYDPRDRTYKMWYLCSGPRAELTCYATSPDGLRWTKPQLDVVPGTNIVLDEPRDSSVVWIDHRETNPARRFKLLRSHAGADKTWGMSLHYSADGIHWTKPVASSHGLSWVGDRSTAFFNPFRNVWVYSIRNSGRHPELGRIRYYSEDADLAAGLSRWRPIPWIGADRLDPHHPKFPEVEPQLYNLDAMAYESLLLGQFSIWEGPDNKICAQLKIQKRNEVLIGYSRDGFHWARPDRRPFLGVNETEGAWNWGNNQSVGGGCLIVGDKLYFYFSGRKRNGIAWDGYGSTGVAFLRRDGFASLNASNKPGEVTTRPVRFTGRYLFVNTSARGGELRAELLDESGAPLAPFTVANCKPVSADSTLARIEWKGAADLARFAGRAVRFRFHLRRGALYAFWVSPDASGASHGYVAAGGPKLNGIIDTK